MTSMWLEARPQLGHEVFARGQPELLGTAFESAHQVNVIEFLWASLALFDDAARDVDTGVVYHPPWHDLHSLLEAWQRILAMFATLPDGVGLDRFLPAIDVEEDVRARPGLRRSSAWASTLLAGLELTREGAAVLLQEGAFTPIHLRQPHAEATATVDPINAAALVAG